MGELIAVFVVLILVDIFFDGFCAFASVFTEGAGETGLARLALAADIVLAAVVTASADEVCA
jgi:hypothetical protein